MEEKKRRQWVKENVCIPKSSVVTEAVAKLYQDEIPYIVFVWEDGAVYLKTCYRKLEDGSYTAHRGYNIQGSYGKMVGKIANSVEEYRKLSDREINREVYNDYMTMVK